MIPPLFIKNYSLNGAMGIAGHLLQTAGVNGWLGMDGLGGHDTHDFRLLL